MNQYQNNLSVEQGDGRYTTRSLPRLKKHLEQAHWLAMHFFLLMKGSGLTEKEFQYFDKERRWNCTRVAVIERVLLERSAAGSPGGKLLSMAQQCSLHCDELSIRADAIRTARQQSGDA